MTSSKRVFTTRAFAPRVFAPGAWRGLGVEVEVFFVPTDEQRVLATSSLDSLSQLTGVDTYGLTELSQQDTRRWFVTNR